MFGRVIIVARAPPHHLPLSHLEDRRPCPSRAAQTSLGVAPKTLLRVTIYTAPRALLSVTRGTEKRSGDGASVPERGERWLPACAVETWAPFF